MHFLFCVVVFYNITNGREVVFVHCRRSSIDLKNIYLLHNPLKCPDRAGKKVWKTFWDADAFMVKCFIVVVFLSPGIMTSVIYMLVPFRVRNQTSDATVQQTGIVNAHYVIALYISIQ